MEVDRYLNVKREYQITQGIALHGTKATPHTTFNSSLLFIRVIKYSSK